MNALFVLRYPALFLLVGVTFVAGLVAIPRLMENSAKRTRPVSTSPPPATMPVVVGNSCSARNCHGDVVPHSAGELSQLENTVWSVTDHHADAWKSLSSDLAKNIELRLAPPGTPPIPADQDARCLACHSTPSTGKVGKNDWHWDTRGVACEACHGRADRWRDEHYAWRGELKKEQAPDLDRRLSEMYAHHGMVWLGDDLSRAKSCAECHVGAPPSAKQDGLPLRDVNHDLIAAGHPRLQFDLNAYLKAMPPHWRERDAKPNLHLRRWAAGQWSAMTAWLELLKYRAKSGNENGWPELAEYRCFSCHHDLKSNAWRQHHSAEPGLAAGSLEWGNYYSHTLADAAAVLFPGLSGESLINDWKELDSALVNPKTPTDQIVSKADSLLREMNHIQASKTGENDSFDVAAFREQLSKRMARALEKPSSMDWDAAAQLLIELRALRDDGDLSPAESENLQKLAGLLSFPPDRLSPSTFDPEASEFRSAIDSSIPATK